jgi:hypothetical protein
MGVAGLSWIERKAASALYATPPESRSVPPVCHARRDLSAALRRALCDTRRPLKPALRFAYSFIRTHIVVWRMWQLRGGAQLPPRCRQEPGGVDPQRQADRRRLPADEGQGTSATPHAFSQQTPALLCCEITDPLTSPSQANAKLWYEKAVSMNPMAVPEKAAREEAAQKLKKL